MAFLKAADGTELFYNDWGTGQPVVLIHGCSPDLTSYLTRMAHS